MCQMAKQDYRSFLKKARFSVLAQPTKKCPEKPTHWVTDNQLRHKTRADLFLWESKWYVVSFLDQELVISYRYWYCSCSCSSSSCWGTSSKRAQGSVVSNRIGMKFGRNVPHVNTHRLTESYFWFNAIISKWRQWRHFTHESAVLPPGEWKRSICSVHMQQRPSVPDL